MTGPAWLAPVLAAVMLLIAVGSLVRLGLWLLRGHAAEPEADVLHVLMAAAMAGMLEPRISALPGAVWKVTFGAAAAWFAWRTVRSRGRQRHAAGWRALPRSWGCADPAPHSVECAAMVYMLMPARSPGHGPAMAMPGMSGAAAGANPAVALVLALFMVGYIVWTADRMTRQSRPPAPVGLSQHGGPAADGRESRDAAAGGSATASPANRATACARIAMGLAMGYMLLTMV